MKCLLGLDAKQNRNSRRIELIIVIAVFAVEVGLAFYFYSVYNSRMITQNSIKEIDKTTRIQTYHLDRILEGKTLEVRNNILLMADSNRVLNEDLSASTSIS